MMHIIVITIVIIIIDCNSYCCCICFTTLRKQAKTSKQIEKAKMYSNII